MWKTIIPVHITCPYQTDIPKFPLLFWKIGEEAVKAEFSRLISETKTAHEISLLSLTENLQAQKYRRRDCFSLPIRVIMEQMMKMDKEKELPQRKHPRLDNYDYSSAGAYFVTICAQNRRCVLSRIVGRGLAPAEASSIQDTSIWEDAEQTLLSIEQYVIMPNHIHVVLILESEAAGASPICGNLRD